MTCPMLPENLSAYLDGELSNEECAEIERHLARCESCRQELRALRSTIGLLAQVSRPEPPAYIASRVVQLTQARQKRVMSAWMLKAGGIMAAASVMVILLLPWMQRTVSPVEADGYLQAYIAEHTSYAAVFDRQAMDIWLDASKVAGGF